MSRLASFVAALLLAGCPLEPAGPTGGSGGEAGAGGLGGGGSGGVGGTPVPPGPPVPFPVDSWMVAKTYAATDPVLPAIEDGSFALPTATGSYLGIFWDTVVPGPNGELEATAKDYLYAGAFVTVPEGTRLFARPDTVATVFTDLAARQPGDFYGSHKTRVPLAVRDGEALILVRALGKKAIPEVQLFATEAEVVLNTEDVTVPDLRVGSAEPQWIGVATLNLTGAPLADVALSVVESDQFEATQTAHPWLAPSSVTQLAWKVVPKGAFSIEGEATVHLKLESPSLAWPYEVDVPLAIVGASARYRWTRRSNVDGSVQYAAVMPPSAPPAPGEQKGLILSLHGASVEAKGQAESYSPKPWAYLVAATNRRPFGFDWEEWGRLDALEALDTSLAGLPIDPLRVHLTGHSMGGHGTWHVGVHFSDRFGVVSPSAGWISFETYTGPPHPTGPIGQARGASRTLDYVDNLANNSVYVIHGSADDNVPVWHAQTMFTTLGPIVPELQYHEEPGARHWWDLDPEEGADCVDWEPMIAIMESRQRDPVQLDFSFTSPAPWVSRSRSFVTVESVVDPLQNFTVVSTSSGVDVSLSLGNVRRAVLDGAALASQGVTTVTVDGVPYPVTGAPIEIGPTGGKRADLSGPLNQVFHKPFCLVWDDAAPIVYRDYASFLLSWWSVVGNGQGCALPASALTSALEAEKNLIFLGPGPWSAGLPFGWDASSIDLAGLAHTGALAFVFPRGDRLAAYVTATEGLEYLLYRYVPFSSRAGMPDFFAWDPDGVVASGFFDSDWVLDPAYAEGLP